MTTICKKPVYREIAGMKIDERRLIVGIHPGGLISVRLKGTQRELAITAIHAWEMGYRMERAEIRRQRKAKRDKRRMERELARAFEKPHPENAQVSGDAWVSGDARVFGNAQVQSPQDLFQAGPLGSRNATISIFRCKAGFNVSTGCFIGTPEEFMTRVIEKHGDNDHARCYRAAMELAAYKMKFTVKGL